MYTVISFLGLAGLGEVQLVYTSILSPSMLAACAEAPSGMSVFTCWLQTSNPWCPHP